MKLVASAAAVLVLGAGAVAWRASDSPKKRVVRVGHFPNLTHAQGVIGHGLSREAKGWFESRLGPDVEVQWFVYNAGPSAMEAFFAGALDLAYVGPNPALNAHLKSDGAEVRILAGACSGGAALVVRADGAIAKDEDFRGKRIGTPQLGNTQDVAARSWLRARGFKVTLTGGDATVVPTANPDQLSLFQKGDLDAVWTVEPWVSRLELDAKAKVYFDEKALWPETNGRYVTTLLAGRTAFVREHRDLVEKWLAAHVDLTAWIRDHADEAKKTLNREMKAETTREIPPELLDRAWGRIELTHDPISASLARNAEEAHRAGFLPKAPDLSRIHDLAPLNAVLKAKGLPEVR